MKNSRERKVKSTKKERKKGKALGREKEERKQIEDVEDDLDDDFTVYTGSETTGTMAFEDYDLDGDEGSQDGGGESQEGDDEPSPSLGGGGGGGTNSTDQRHFRQLQDALNAASELPSEKRATKRETTLRKLFKALTQYSTSEQSSELVEQHVDETIIPACLYSINKGSSSAEQYVACRNLEALSVLLGGDRDEFCDVIDESLRKTVKATGRAHLTRGAALRALCLSNFICSTDESLTYNLIDLCEQVCAERWRGIDNHPILRATALDCWALLSTTVADAYIAGDDDGRGVTILPLLQQCLDHDSTDLRAAAGECVTLIHEARLDMGIGQNGEEGFNVTERRYRRGSWDGSEVEVLMDELRQRMSELSVESGHRMSKKAKKEQRSVFREFMATVVDDEAPNEIVSFRGGSLNLTSWREIIQLDFIRHCLQGGFQIQLMTNPTLLFIFGADGEVLRDAAASALGGGVEKRLVMSKNSSAAKKADIELSRNRKSRNNAKNHFITVDGEDI